MLHSEHRTPGGLTKTSSRRSRGYGLTEQAIIRQLDAMGANSYDIAVRSERTGQTYIENDLTVEQVLAKVPELRKRNGDLNHIDVQPHGPSSLTFIDDLNEEKLERLKAWGWQPAVVVETSPQNYQAWLKHARVLTADEAKLASSIITNHAQGDTGAVAVTHMGKLGGFTNPKLKHMNEKGYQPFVLVREWPGKAFDDAIAFGKRLASKVEAFREFDEAAAGLDGDYRDAGDKTIDYFRHQAKYSGDHHREDYAYALYAAGAGRDPEKTMQEILESRDLSKKGNANRQWRYVESTVLKAFRELRERPTACQSWTDRDPLEVLSALTSKRQQARWQETHRFLHALSDNTLRLMVHNGNTWIQLKEFDQVKGSELAMKWSGSVRDQMTDIKVRVLNPEMSLHRLDAGQWERLRAMEIGRVAVIKVGKIHDVWMNHENLNANQREALVEMRTSKISEPDLGHLPGLTYGANLKETAELVEADGKNVGYDFKILKGLLTEVYEGKKKILWTVDEAYMRVSQAEIDQALKADLRTLVEDRGVKLQAHQERGQTFYVGRERDHAITLVQNPDKSWFYSRNKDNYALRGTAIDWFEREHKVPFTIAVRELNRLSEPALTEKKTELAHQLEAALAAPTLSMN